jgi:adenylate cyclase
MFSLVALMATVYLFVTAPPALPEAAAEGGKRLSAHQVLEICAAENAAVRELYVKEIVGAGQKVGLRFEENWEQLKVDAGPLPALFLRETSKSLAHSPVNLGLFLGSDNPISKSNRFSGQQAEALEEMRRNGEPRGFFVNDVNLYTAMFPDFAVAKACVDCHNQHRDSPKRDWKLGDLMGATTWTFPSKSVSVSEALEVIAALRNGFRDAYAHYIEKTKTFSSPPEVGKKWPSQCYCLPTPETFMQAAERRTSKPTLDRLLSRRPDALRESTLPSAMQ